MCGTGGYTHYHIWQVWSGVGWTSLMYIVTDSQGKAFEALFVIMYILGAWFLINLMIAVLGTSFEKEQLKQRAIAAEHARALERRRAQQAGVAATGFVGRMMNRFKSGAAAAKSAAAPAAAPAAAAAQVRSRLSMYMAAQEEEERAAPKKGLRGRARAIVSSFWFKALIVIIILSNTVVTAADGPFVKAVFGAGTLEMLLRGLSRMFGAFFLIEMLLKLFALGFRGYAADRWMDGWMDG